MAYKYESQNVNVSSEFARTTPRRVKIHVHAIHARIFLCPRAHGKRRKERVNKKKPQKMRMIWDGFYCESMLLLREPRESRVAKFYRITDTKRDVAFATTLCLVSRSRRPSCMKIFMYRVSHDSFAWWNTFPIKIEFLNREKKKIIPGSMSDDAA